MKVLDYSFYRIYTFYKKHKDSIPIFMGCGVISTVLCFSMFTIMVITQFVFKTDIEINKLVIVGFIISLLLLLGKRFNDEKFIALLSEKYDGEKVSKKRWRGLFIVLYILIVVITPLLYGYLKNNCHMDI